MKTKENAPAGTDVTDLPSVPGSEGTPFEDGDSPVATPVAEVPAEEVPAEEVPAEEVPVA